MHDARSHEGEKFGAGIFDEREEALPLVLVMEIKRSVAEACRAGDVLRPGVVIAAFDKKFAGGDLEFRQAVPTPVDGLNVSIGINIHRTPFVSCPYFSTMRSPAREFPVKSRKSLSRLTREQSDHLQPMAERNAAFSKLDRCRHMRAGMETGGAGASSRAFQRAGAAAKAGWPF
jgi:hypothetical protein